MQCAADGTKLHPEKSNYQETIVQIFDKMDEKEQPCVVAIIYFVCVARPHFMSFILSLPSYTKLLTSLSAYMPIMSEKRD